MPNLRHLIVVFLVLISSNSFAQKSEFLSFRNEINFYLDFVNHRVDSLKVNEVNQTKYTKCVDDAFLSFAKVANSHLLDTFRLAKDDTTKHFLFMDNRTSFTVKSFYSSFGHLAVYSYTSSARNKYLIKDIVSDKVVLIGSRNIAYVSDVFYLDSTHVMVIEEHGDQHTSRMAMVYSVTTQGWNQLNAFEGFSNEFNKKGESVSLYKKNRPYFQLECSWESSMLLPQDVSKIYYDSSTRILKYKLYDANKLFKWVAAKWENNLFIIDDVNVDEVVSQGGVEIIR